ncbi:MAG: MFS transporter [Novosphingobium sp.]
MTSNFGIGWRQVALSFVLLAAVAMIATSYSVLAVPLAQEFRPSRVVLMLAMTVLAGVSGLLAPFLGNLMDRFSLRHLMLAGTLMLAAGYAALSLASTFTQVLVIFGLFMAPANVLLGPVAVTVLLSRWFVKRRGRAIGIAVAGVAMGGVIFPPLIQWLLDSYEWRVALRVFSLIILVATVPAAALVVNSPADRGFNPDGAPVNLEDARAEGEAPQVSVATILSDPAFWMVGILFALVLSGMKGMVTNLAPLAIDEGIDAGDAALLISIYAGCGFIAKLAFAAVADWFSPRTLTLLGFAGFACGMACLTQAGTGYWAIALGVCLIGLFGGLMVPLKSLLVPRIFGQKVVGRAMGMMSVVSLCAMLATPPLFGLAFDLTGSYATISLSFAVLAAAAMLLVPYIRMHPRDVTAATPGMDRKPA